MSQVQQRLAFPNRLNDATQLRNWARPDWQYCDTRIMEWAALFIEELRRANCPFYVHSAFRTREQQDKHVRDGVSKTPWPAAAHCQGKAVDIVHGLFHWDLTDNEWLWVGAIGRQVHEKLMAKTPKADRWPLVWGGSWNKGRGPTVLGWDPAHWEIGGWKQQPILRIIPGPAISHTPRGLLTIFGHRK